jgi:glucose-1-phosphate thymidylyltransferase
MRIVIPMAGMGKRLRPHTLVTPKPLVRIAEKPIVQRLVEDIVSIQTEKVEEIAFIIGRFGKEVENNLIALAEQLGAKGTIHYQDQALGTAHAIMCAQSALTGPVTVAFADTLFRADFKLDPKADGVLWVKKIEDPRQFGVVELNAEGTIVSFQEKPQEFISDLAMIGIYYFKDGEWLKREIQYLLDNNIMNGGEYQLPDAMRNMMKKGAKFVPGEVDEWMDCGNKKAVVETMVSVVSRLPQNHNVQLQGDSKIIEPCYFGSNVIISNSIVGPNVSVASNVSITNSKLENTSIESNCKIENCQLTNSLVDEYCQLVGVNGVLDLGSYNSIQIND